MALFLSVGLIWTQRSHHICNYMEMWGAFVPYAHIYKTLFTSNKTPSCSLITTLAVEAKLLIQDSLVFCSKTKNCRIHNKPHGGTKARSGTLKFESVDRVVLSQFVCPLPVGFETIFSPMQHKIIASYSICKLMNM